MPTSSQVPCQPCLAACLTPATARVATFKLAFRALTFLGVRLHEVLGCIHGHGHRQSGTCGKCRGIPRTKALFSKVVPKELQVGWSMLLIVGTGTLPKYRATGLKPVARTVGGIQPRPPPSFALFMCVYSKRCGTVTPIATEHMLFALLPPACQRRRGVRRCMSRLEPRISSNACTAAPAIDALMQDRKTLWALQQEERPPRSAVD